MANRIKVEKSGTSLSGLSGSTSYANSANGKMGKIQKSQGFPKPQSSLKITLYNKQRDLPISASSVKGLVSFLSKTLKITGGEIIIHLVSERKICKLHKDFFHDPSPTDCITFPIQPLQEENRFYTTLGEIFICPKVALQYAIEHRLNPYKEASRYIVHGILHLLGYDDIDPKEQVKMRAKENRCLKMLIQKKQLLTN
jgi:probable rRNA maturation factor